MGLPFTSAEKEKSKRTSIVAPYSSVGDEQISDSFSPPLLNDGTSQPMPSTRRASLIDTAIRRFSVELMGAFPPDSPELETGNAAGEDAKNSSKPPPSDDLPSDVDPPATSSSLSSLTPDTGESISLNPSASLFPTFGPDEKISLAFHTLHSNLTSALTSVPALALLYFVYSYVSIRFPLIGGMWGDKHAILCAACVTSMEIILVFVWNFDRGYIFRHAVLQWPVMFASFLLISKFVFDDRPSHWTSALMTFCFALGMTSTYWLQPSPRPTFIKHLKKTAVYAFGGHGGVILVIYGQVIPTKLLSQSNPLLASLATGAAFPFMNWVMRKLLIGIIANATRGKLERGGEREANLRSFNRLVKMTSSFLALTPCVLNYLNTTVELAVLSAVLQMATEVLGKVWIVYFTRKTFADYIAVIEGERGALLTALTLAAQEPGLNTQFAADPNVRKLMTIHQTEIKDLKRDVDVLTRDVTALATENEALRSQIKELGGVLRNPQELAPNPPQQSAADPGAHEEGSEGRGGEVKKMNGTENEAAAYETKKKDVEAKLDRALLLLAARWNAEITAEKVGIIVASLIAIMVFGGRGGEDGEGLSLQQLLLVAAIFFAMEVVTDITFVYVMERYLRVPILSKAINATGIFTKSVLQDSAVICLSFVGVGACVKMADMIPL